MVVDEHSGTLDGYPKVGLACDHMQMSRFAGPGDSNYCYVRDTVIQMVESAPERIIKKLKRKTAQWFKYFGIMLTIVGRLIDV